MGRNKKIVMSIAGSDPSSGAGIQADLKTFTALGLHGVTVITCVTAQNTHEVKSIYKIPVEIIENQIDIILEEMKPEIVKTGMLYDEEIVKSVAKKIKQYDLKVVVDPVMVATSKDNLSTENFSKFVKKEILPISYILTPNIHEANVLTGKKIGNLDDVKTACKELYKMGPENILIKGGHLQNEYAQDVFYDGGKISVFSLPRIPNKLAHGSGCTISALITGYLALGEKPISAARKSKNVLWNMINKGYIPGKGADVLNFNYQIIQGIPLSFQTEDHFNVWYDLKESVDKLLSFLTKEYVAEVGMNIGYALPSAKKLEDICAINGRIIKTKIKPVACGSLEFGAAKHVGSIILAAMSFDSSVRCAINIKYSNETVEKCKKIGFKIVNFDRKNEPKNTKSTMEWGTKHVIKQFEQIPDIIYDTGAIGKEPMIRILGKNPKDVLNKLEKILR